MFNMNKDAFSCKLEIALLFNKGSPHCVVVNVLDYEIVVTLGLIP